MDERDLKNLTKEYWGMIDHRNPSEHLEWYIDNLLPHEMDWADKHPIRDGEPRLPVRTRPCKLLVLLVGFSVEPLLQAVWAYEPENILLLLNQQYGDPDNGGREGIVFGTMIQRLIREHLASRKPLASKPDVNCELVEAGPVPVFQKLVEKVDATEGVVIDITGAKKSMVAGAFLYAAYANVDVSYVDFDDKAFDPEQGRPYGYACRIGYLSNPYQAFALRDWEWVRELYNRYNFRAARELLVGLDGNGGPGTILDATKTYLPTIVEPVQKLGRMLHCYELSDSGDFNKAKEKADEITQEGWNSDFPDAINKLGGKWFTVSGSGFTNPPKGFYDDTPELRVYIYDEIKRIERLIRLNEDYRSAFLRAGGVNEILMLTRLVRLVKNPVDKQSLLNALDERTPGARSLFEALCQPGGSKIEIGKDRSKTISFKGVPEISIGLPQPMTPWWQSTQYFNGNQGWEDFLDKRNELAHKYFTVPRDWAEDVLRFVKANFEDFLSRSMDSLGLCAEVLPWSSLCERCGLKGLLSTGSRGTVVQEHKTWLSPLQEQLERACARVKPFSLESSPFFAFPAIDMGETSAENLDKIIAEYAYKGS
jgi:hypothetical protein